MFTLVYFKSIFFEFMNDLVQFSKCSKMSIHQIFLNVVNKAQNEEYCHKKLIKSIENSFDISNLEMFLNVYSKTLLQLYCSEYADKNPFVARGLEFLAKLAIKITLKCVQPLDVTNPNGTVSQVYNITTDQFFTNLLKCSLKCASVEKPEVRFNTCYFVMVLLQQIGNNVELDCGLCNNILESLVELLNDPKVNVRLQSLKALVRLQEPGNPECVVLNSFLGLFTDVNCEIRKAVVSQVAPHPQSFAKIRERLTDTDIGVRQAAYTKWADTNPRLYLKIVDRNFILTCGFADSNKKIKQILTEKLLPKWLNAYGGNYLDLLKALKLDADENDIKNFENLCTKVMNIYLKIHPLSDILKYLPTSKEDKLIPVRQLHIESVLYWSIIVNFLRERDDSEDYLENILPELTPFSNYIERVVKDKSATSMDEWENLEYQNIILQLFKMASGFDMCDEVGRKTFYSLILQILSTYKFQQKVIDSMVTVAFQLNHNVDILTTDFCQVISEIREPLIDESPSEDKLRARNFELSQLKVKIHRLEIAEEDALKVKDFQHANIVHNELMECKRQFDNLKNIYSQSEKVRVSKDDPETLCRCLDILIGVLKIPNITTMSVALHTCKKEFLMPLLNNTISEVHWRFILCLGLFSLLDKDTAFEHANFLCLPIATYRAVPNYDKNALKISVTCVADLIRVYGVEVMGIERSDSDSVVNQDNNNQTNRRKLYSEDMNELQAVNKDDISIEFIIDIILDMLDDEDEDVRNNAVNAISRLMVHNFPVNPELITRLILKWYNPLTMRKDTKLQQQVGFIITCFTDNVKGSRRIIEKAVIPIISSLANAPRTSPLVEVDVDNVLRFLSALTNIANTNETENIHNSLAFSIIKKISNKPDDVCTPHLAKLLTYLDVKSDDVSSIKNMISSAELLLEDVLDKAPNKKILKFINKLRLNTSVHGGNAEDTATTLNGADSVSESVVNNSTNPSEGNRDTSGPKSTSISRLSNNSQEVREVRKRTLYLHNIDIESNESDEDNEEKSSKGNSSESEEGENVEVNDKVSVGKNHKKSCDSVRASKKLSLMKLRRKLFTSSKNPLKGKKTLQKITEGPETEESSEKRKEKIQQNKKPTKNGNDKTSIKKVSDSRKAESSSDESTTVFVKCDYTPLKTGVSNADKLNNGQNACILKSKSTLNVDNAKQQFDKVVDKKLPVKETTRRQSSKLRKINIHSQVVLGTSETIISESPSKAIDKAGTSHNRNGSSSSAQQSCKKKNSYENKSKNILNEPQANHETDMRNTSRRRSRRRNQFRNDTSMSATESPSGAFHERPVEIKSSQKKALNKINLQKVTSSPSLGRLTSLDDKSNSSRISSSESPPQISTTTNSVRSSPRMGLPPRKLIDYATPSISERIRQRKHVSQGSAGHTPFRTSVVNTPLSVLGDRLSKKSFRAVEESVLPKSSRNSRTTKISLENPAMVRSNRKNFRHSVRGKKIHVASESSSVRKRPSDIPSSLLKEKPNKLYKITNYAEQNDKSINEVGNSDSETDKSNSCNKSEIDKKKNKNMNVLSTVESKSKDMQSKESITRIIKSRNNFDSKTIKYNTSVRRNELRLSLRSQKSILTIKKDNVESFSKKNCNGLRKENHNGLNKANNEKKKELRPVLTKLSGTEEKIIFRRSERIKTENRINGKQECGEEENKSVYSDDDTSEKQPAKKNDNLKEIPCETLKAHSNSKTKVKCSRVLLNSDQNSKISAKVLRSSNGLLNNINFGSKVLGESSKKFKKTETILNQSSRTRNGLKFNGDLSVERGDKSRLFTSTETRSRMNNGPISTRNRSSKRHLDFSSSSEETLLKTFLQGDEEFQMLEDILIEDITSRSNTSGDSKKENLSINKTSSSSTLGETRRTLRRIRTTDSSSSSGSPKRKILRTNQRRTLRSAVQ